MSASDPAPARPDAGPAVAAVRARVERACARVGRSPSGVRVLGATKGVPVEAVRAAAAAGVTDFAENYASELAAKAPLVPARWHFIGRLQRGTAARVADSADVVQSAEPGDALARLARRASRRGRRIECLAQVDFTGRRQGVSPDAVGAFVEEAAGLEGVVLIGLMTLPPPTPHPEGARPYFRRLRELRDALAERHPQVRELSMGMSADLEIGVEEGATMVRVGTALFGPRPPRGGRRGA